MSKIIEHTSNGFKWLLVEVPEDAKEFDLPEQDYGNVLQYKTNHWESEVLPSGSWETVGKADSLTEGQWKEMVKDLKEPAIGLVYYKDYTIHSRTDKIQFPCDTAKEAGLTLLRSHGLKESETLILKSTAI